MNGVKKDAIYLQKLLLNVIFSLGINSLVFMGGLHYEYVAIFVFIYSTYSLILEKIGI